MTLLRALRAQLVKDIAHSESVHKRARGNQRVQNEQGGVQLGLKKAIDHIDKML